MLQVKMKSFSFTYVYVIHKYSVSKRYIDWRSFLNWVDRLHVEHVLQAEQQQQLDI